MSAEQTLINVKVWCIEQSNDEQIWTNKKGTTYHWNRGRDTYSGEINGVVRKVAGINSAGGKIWQVAGSLKIDQQGNILRFTGIPKKVQKMLASNAVVIAQVEPA